MMNPRARLFLVLVALFLLPAVVGAATINVNAGGNLQAALDAAQPGDTIVLQAGATFVGSFVLRYKPGTGTDADWITIRTSTPDSSLPPGKRVTPADASRLAKLFSPGLAQPALQTEPRAHHYRLIGLEIAPRDAQAFLYDVILLGANGPEQDTLEEVPHHITLDRCYIYAHPTQGLKRGIQLNSAHTDIIDSYIAGFKVIGQEAQAIGGFNGPGPYKIINNYLEGAGENILFGGATASIPNLIPSDIEIRRNHFFKPLSWRVGDPTYAGYHWSVKNLFELKNARRVVIDGNIFENNWADAQAGVAILFTVRGEGGDMPWATVEDVQFTNNILRNTPGAFNILGRDDSSPSQRASRITIRNNVLEEVSDRFLVITDTSDVTIDHNTVFHGGNITAAYGTPSDRFTFTNNLMAHNTYGVHGDGQSSGNGALNAFFPGAVFRRNLIAGANAAVYPADNFYPPSLDDARFVDRPGGNYRLAPDSPYRNQGTDGKDVGADIGLVEERTSGVRSGVWAPPSSGQTPYPGPGATAAPGTIEVENFDAGGEGVAYHDADAGNNGGEYRTGGVDVRSKSTASNGHVVFNAVAGEWLEYTISVATAGTYDIGATSASRLAGGTYHIEIDGVNVTGTITAPTTGSWWDFQYAGKTGVSLSAGTHVLRLVLDTNGAETVVADFDTIVISAASSAQTPFQGTPFAVPGTVPASDFDNGGEGIAYHDLTPGNVSSSTYRTSDVDLYDRSVLRIEDGEWLEYTVEVGATASTYAFVAQVSAEQAGGSLHVEVDGVDRTGPLAVPVTGSWAIWGSAIETGVSLSAGRHVVRVAVDSAFDGFHSLRIANTGAVQAPFGGTARSLPGTIAAADFDEGGEMVAYHDNTEGCSGSCGSRTADVDRYGQVVYQTGAGEWLEYTVDVAAAGTYKVQVRAGSEAGGGTFHVEFDDVDVTGPLAIPNTGSWGTFQTVTKTGVALSAGRKVMRIVVDDAGGTGTDAGSFESITVAP